MQPIIYRFFIDGTEVRPVYKTITKKYEKENNQQLFREKLEGEIKLYGDDYFLIKDSSIFAEHTFKVQIKNKAGIFEDYYTGFFSKTDCEFDYDKRICKLKITPKDSYTDILNNYSNEYNLADLAPALTPVNIAKRPILQVYALDDNIISNFLPSGTTWETEVDTGKSLTELYEKGFDIESKHIEVTIATGGAFDGIYTGSSWVYSTLMSPTNMNYKIVGTVELSGDTYTYFLHIFDINDISLSNKLYTTGVATSNSRFTTLKFYNPNNSNDSFSATVSMEIVLTRILTGASVTFDGQVAIYKLVESDFGYIDNYLWAYPSIAMCNSTMVPANSQEPTKYGKADNGNYFVEPIAPNNKYYPFAKSTWINSSRWLYLNDAFSKTFDINGSIYIDIKDCIHIADVIKALLKKVAPNISHEATIEYSNFLYGDSNPVYGEKFELFITQKTHLKKFIYDTAATKVPITFEKVMGMLAKCFCCYWYIEDYKLKIEHISYFENGKNYAKNTQLVGLDTTTIYDTKNGRPIGYGQNNIKYDKNALSSRYEFGYMDDSSLEFEGPAVKFTAPYLQQDKTESITPEDFSADLDMIVSNTINISDDGFALIAAKLAEDSDGYKFYTAVKYNLELVADTGEIYTTCLQNGVLSWFYLFNFYCTNLPTLTAEYDGFPKKSINAIGVAKCMSHEIKIPVETDPDVYALVTTYIGTGQINRVSIDLTTRQASIELMYEPE